MRGYLQKKSTGPPAQASVNAAAPLLHQTARFASSSSGHDFTRIPNRDAAEAGTSGAGEP